MAGDIGFDTDIDTCVVVGICQVYREAVAAWNALTPEEKEDYRGVCPGLTPYQCYMKTALLYVPPVPPPEEKTEEQTQSNTLFQLNLTYRRNAQKVTIPAGRKITKLGFWLTKQAATNGNIDMRIRRVSDDGIELEKLWGAQADLAAEETYTEVTFDTPKVVSGECYLSVEYDGTGGTNTTRTSVQSTDVKANELFCYYTEGSWNENAGWDCAYRYKYYEVE